jgi:two-component system, LytTR family, response regulator
MKIRCLVIDDEPLARQGIAEHISQVPFLELADSLPGAMQAYTALENGDIDLILLDIEMPKLNGIEFLKSLKRSPLIILTTAYPGYAIEGYELGVVDYLLKPISFGRFLKSVNKVKDLIVAKKANSADLLTTTPEEKGCFFIKESGTFRKLFYEDVLFVEALQNYVAIHVRGKKYIAYITLTIIEQQLPANMFLKIHKSYIIALSKISALEGNTVYIDAVQIPVSRTMKDELMKKVIDIKLLKR